MPEHDPAMIRSNFARKPGEKYYTEHWCTHVLAHHLQYRDFSRPIWEPAAGRGDISMVLMEHGYDVVSSDIDVGDFDPELGSIQQMDFLTEPFDFAWCEDYSGIITNPPYGGDNVEYEGKSIAPAEAFVRKSLDSGMDFVAMLMRSEFNSAGGRTDLFRTGSNFAFEIVLTSRPRWDDWWNGEKPKASPRHNFSWFVWDRQWTGVNTQFWLGKDDVQGKTE